MPGLKSAKEYEAEGVNMMELNQKLLEKIEELTLYSISQKNEIEGLQKGLEELTFEMDLLKQFLSKNHTH